MPVKTHRRRVPRIPKGRRMDVRRDEYNQLVDILNARGEILKSVLREQQIQFQRIAQMQAELDRFKQTVARMKVE